MNELLPYVLLFLILGGVMSAWLLRRWARKKAARQRILAFEQSLQVAVRAAHQMMLERRSPEAYSFSEAQDADHAQQNASNPSPTSPQAQARQQPRSRSESVIYRTPSAGKRAAVKTRPT
jgi:hypothetical protein